MEDSKKKSIFKARKISEKIDNALKNGEITTSFEFFPAKTAKGTFFFKFFETIFCFLKFAVQSVPRLSMALVGHFQLFNFIVEIGQRRSHNACTHSGRVEPTIAPS